MKSIARLTLWRGVALICLSAGACSGAGGVGAVSCGTSAPLPPPSTSASPGGAAHPTIGQLPAIDVNALLQHTRVLSSDEYEGRAPGTKGEERTVTYLADEFQKVGLKPGNADGTYFQKVPLVGITPAPAPLVFKKGAQEQTLKWKDDVVAWTKHVAES